MKIKKIISSNDIALVVTTKDNIEYLATLLSDIELMSYTFSKTFTKKEAIEYINNNFNFNNNLGFSPILLNSKPIGFGGVFKFDKNSYELGYILDKRYWGKGLATKVALMQRDYIVNRLHSAAVATTHPDNLASQRVLQKCGFEYIKDIFMPNRGERKLFEYKNGDNI